MSEPDATQPISRIHLGETILAIARLHDEHRSSATRHPRIVEHATSILGRPSFIVVLTLLVIAWLGLNGLAFASGYHPFDPPPFAWLAGFASLASLYLVVVILTTQRRDDLLARHRQMSTLELAILAEKESAKAIAPFEELRRDSPLVYDRVDRRARRNCATRRSADGRRPRSKKREPRPRLFAVSRKARNRPSGVSTCRSQNRGLKSRPRLRIWRRCLCPPTQIHFSLAVSSRSRF